MGYTPRAEKPAGFTPGAEKPAGYTPRAEKTRGLHLGLHPRSQERTNVAWNGRGKGRE